MRTLISIVVFALLAVGGVFVFAGTRPGPSITITNPTTVIGVSSPLDITVDPDGTTVGDVQVAIEQKGVQSPVFVGGQSDADRQVTRAPTGVVRITHVVGKASVPALTSGPARLVVTASRSVLFGLRQVVSSVSRDVTVRLEKPMLSVLSTHHYVNQGGAEAIVYRVTPADGVSGVRVGDDEYPGFPAAGLTAEGVTITDKAVRVAVFALTYDQGPDTPMTLFARDEAGNAATASFDARVFPKPARQSRIELPDAFLARVVPSILATTQEVAPAGGLIDQFLVINGELRRKNAERIASLAAQTSSELLWQGVAFHPFTNSAVESAFADRRTYVHDGQEVDRQVHLGFDLASYTNTPIVAANRGRVVFAGMLGIYGNTVIIDHGLGVQSLYAHLSSIGTEVGAMVEKEQPVGRSGLTGLAGGDHLHFTMLVNGRMVNPVEWWDPHWIEDRILRKLREVK